MNKIINEKLLQNITLKSYFELVISSVALIFCLPFAKLRFDIKNKRNTKGNK